MVFGKRGGYLNPAVFGQDEQEVIVS
uniref:Uncharacterized protein n=1 Tax=Anopheles minimus TaxID=112268 RepID=A0A182WMP3_9DIPT